jgi:hypothetical protein
MRDVPTAPISSRAYEADRLTALLSSRHSPFPSSSPRNAVGDGGRAGWFSGGRVDKGRLAWETAIGQGAVARGLQACLFRGDGADGRCRWSTAGLPFHAIGTYNGSAVSQMINGGPYYVNVTSDGT